MKKYTWLGLSLLVIALIGMYGCAKVADVGTALPNNVAWGTLSDGGGTALQDGGTTSYRTMTISGTIEAPTIATALSTGTIVAATVEVNGNQISLNLTNLGTYYSFSGSIELFRGTNTIIIRNVDSQGTIYASNPLTVTCTAAAVAIHIQLTWDKDGTDVDLHLIKPGGAFAKSPGTDASDCAFSNKTPDWDGDGVRNTVLGGPINDAQDPALDIDDVNGYGPENTVIQTPADGVFTVKAYYWSDHSYGSTIPTVKVWINESLIKTYVYNAASLGEFVGTGSSHSLWTPCTITVAGSSITLSDVGSIETAGVLSSMAK